MVRRCSYNMHDKETEQTPLKKAQRKFEYWEFVDGGPFGSGPHGLVPCEVGPDGVEPHGVGPCGLGPYTYLLAYMHLQQLATHLQHYSAIRLKTKDQHFIHRSTSGLTNLIK